MANPTSHAKRCSKCGELKALDAFSPNRGGVAGKHSHCKVCRTASARKWNVEHPKRVRETKRKHHAANLVKCQGRARARYAAKPEQYRAQARRRYAANPKRYENDPQYRLANQLRIRLHHAIAGNFKTGSAVRDLGCSIRELRTRLETQFQEGMSWANHAPKGWHIDHIKPLASFDLANREQFLEACHYTNLQPLWAADNLCKGAGMSEAVTALVL